MVKKVLEGVVKSNRMEKTLVVEREFLFRHKRYKKVIRTNRKMYVHHEQENVPAIGSRVLVEEGRPMSRLKRWFLLKILG